MALVSPEFLAAHLPSGRNTATLVKVELTDPSALTLYLSNVEVITPGANPQFWQAALSDVGSVVEHGGLGTEDPGLAIFDFELSGRPLQGQSVNESALELLASYYWHGATVTAYWWELSMTDFTKAAQIFKGRVIDVETDSNRATIYCQQRSDWIRRVPLKEVTRERYPRAPEKSLGLAEPECYGDLRDLPARWPADRYGLFNQGITSIVGMRRAGVRGVQVRQGKGGAGEDARVLFAGHACKIFNSDVDGSTPALIVGNRLAEIDPDGALDFNGAGGTGFDFNDITSAAVEPFDTYFPVPPSNSKAAASNNGDNARGVVDVFNDTSFGLLDYDAGKRSLIFELPDVSPVGKLLDLKMVIGYLTEGGVGVPVYFEFVGSSGSDAGSLTASTTKTAQSRVILSTYWPPDYWGFGTDGAYLQVYFGGVATGQKVRVYYFGLALKVRPEWPTIANSYIIPGFVNDTRQVNTLRGARRHHYRRHEPSLDRYVPAVERVDSVQFYATLQGHADSGGTYTGSGTDLVERPPDVLRHFLATSCGESLFETGVGEPGSLVDLRNDTKTWRASDMKLAFALDEFAHSSDVLRTIGRSALIWPFISCFTDKWCAVAWKPGRAVDFPRRLTRYDVMDPAGPKVIVHRGEVQNDLALSFGRDAYTRRLVGEVFLGPGRSSGGHDYLSLRDERITVVASASDKLDFSDGASRTVTLTTGDYTPIGFAIEVSGKVAAVTTNSVCQVAWGFQIVSGYNQRLDFNDGAAQSAFLNVGTYTGATMATEVARAMNAVSSNWSCSYSATTGKFTISRSAGTAQLKFATGGGALTGCAVVLGFGIADKTAGSPYTSDFAVEPERFALGLLTSTLSLLWETGSNGIDAATPRACGSLLGFDMARDYAEGTTYAAALSPKNKREQDMATSATRYGARPPLNVALEYVNDTDTAREVRNRIASLWKQPPVEIQFPTERMPDLQKGMVFDFDASLDEVKPYVAPGSDGSWLGKKFVAVRVERICMPIPHQSVVAFEVPAE